MMLVIILRKKITDKCHFYHVDYFIVDENIETISKAVGKNNRVAIRYYKSRVCEKNKRNDRRLILWQNKYKKKKGSQKKKQLQSNFPAKKETSVSKRWCDFL